MLAVIVVVVMVVVDGRMENREVIINTGGHINPKIRKI